MPRKKTHWVAWRKPQVGFIKINFDESKLSRGVAGSFIICNQDEKFIQTSTFNLTTSSVLKAEATTLLNGIKVTVQVDFTNIQIEGDNKILIQAIQGQIQLSWEIKI